MKMLISSFDNSNVEMYIDRIENEFDFQFPQQYRDFLLKYNGGRTPNTNFAINQISSDIICFYGLGKVEANYNYDLKKNSLFFTDFLEENFLPIGKNSFGDFILIGTGEKNAGQVFFYYHDKKKKFIKLTHNFIEFTSMCKSDKIKTVRSIEERKADMILLGKGGRITPEKLKGWQDEIDIYSNINQVELIL